MRVVVVVRSPLSSGVVSPGGTALLVGLTVVGGTVVLGVVVVLVGTVVVSFVVVVSGGVLEVCACVVVVFLPPLFCRLSRTNSTISSTTLYADAVPMQRKIATSSMWNASRLFIFFTFFFFFFFTFSIFFPSLLSLSVF